MKLHTRLNSRVNIDKTSTWRLHDFNNLNSGLKKVAVLFALSLFFNLIPKFSTINSKCFDTFASVWLTATARNHSALCRTKKAPTTTISEPIHSVGHHLALLNRGLKYITTITLFRRSLYSESTSLLLKVFARFPEKCSSASKSLNKHAVDSFTCYGFLFFAGRCWKYLPAPPIHFGISTSFPPQPVPSLANKVVGIFDLLSPPANFSKICSKRSH